MDLTLEQLLASLSAGMDKRASDEKDEKKEDKKEDEKDEKKKNPFAKKEDKDEKDEDKEDKDEGVEKEASLQGSALAREVMEKVANLNIESVTGMKKTAAATAGKTLADALLKKLASAGDVITQNGIDPNATPNKNQVDNAAMKAEDDAKIKPMVTSDGNQPTGSINEIFDAIVADAMSQGAASTDQVHTTGVAAAEGAVEDRAVPNQVNEKVAALNELMEQGVDFDEATDMIKQAELEHAEDLEKTAAVQTLVESGIDFDTASDLVKQAAFEIEAEEDGMAKAAAVSELMANGVDFDEAVKMVKEASVGDVTTEDGIDPNATPNKNQVDNAAMKVEDDAKVKPMATSDGQRPQGSINEIFDAIVADAMAQGAVSTDQVHTTGVAAAEGAVEDRAVPNQVKSAALQRLMEAGVDFESASTLVKEAAEKSAMDFKGLAKNVPAMAKSVAGRAAASFKGASAATKMGIAGAAGLTAGVVGANAMSEKKAEALSLLIEQGVDFDEATQLVKEASEKVANDHKLKGYFAPNWQENSIARDHGKEGLKGFKANAGKFLVGSGRIAGRGVLEGVAGSLLGQGVSALSRGKINPEIAAGIGGQVGSIHGAVSSLKNQANEAHAKYAALTKLLEQGVDFDEATRLVKEAAAK